MGAPTTGPAETPATTRTPLRAIFAGAVGNVIEWYDFSVYGYLAVVISAVFFPTGSTQLLLTFATFGVGFVMRPVGAIVLGHFGDRLGRNKALMFTVVLMAVSTFLIGVIPSYATIGIWAPIILLILRLLQGLSAGGEWGGSASFMVEYARQDRRGFIGSWQQFTIVVSLLLGAAVGTAVTGLLSHDALYSWGWRVPFLAGIIVGPVGLYLRYGIPDTPKFRELDAKGKVERAPLLETFRSFWRDILRAFGFTIVWTVAYYIYLTYLPTYLETEVGLSKTFSLIATMVELAFMAILVPFMGLLSDRIGRKPMLLTSCALFIVLPFPLFVAVGASKVAVILVVLAFAASLAIFSGPGPAAIAELFATNVRYSALSIPYNIATAAFGGFAPFIATLLISVSGGQRLAPTFYVIAAAVVSLLTVLTFKERSREELR
ncbi:MAG: MFS transporter [Streptosporangiales bacterium]